MKLLRRLSIAALCFSVAWGVFITVSATVSWSRTGGIMLIVAGLLGIAANINSERHDRRRQVSPAVLEPPVTRRVEPPDSPYDSDEVSSPSSA